MKDDAKGTAAVVTSGESTVPLMTLHPRSGSRRGSVFRSVETIRPGQEPASARRLSAGSERQGCEQSLHVRLQMWVTGTTAIPDRSNPLHGNHAVEACHPHTTTVPKPSSAWLEELLEGKGDSRRETDKVSLSDSGAM